MEFGTQVSAERPGLGFTGPTPARTFRSTNAIESMISVAREHAKNVKRWRDGTMTLR